VGREEQQSGADRLRERALSEDSAVFGAWMTVPSQIVLEGFSRSAIDYVGIDCQHGRTAEWEILDLLAKTGGSGAPKIVRVSANRCELVGKVLDGGADGVIIPGIDSAGDAEDVVRAVRYPPDGIRSYGPTARFLPREPTDLAQRVLVLPMIETAAGLEAVEEIVAVDGVDGVYVGPADLGLALGLGWRQFPASEELLGALDLIATAARAAGKIAGIHAGGHEFVAPYLGLGYRLLTLQAEAAFLRAGVDRVLEKMALAGAESTADSSPY
jgi:2-keto-3-deoxy-L-rhamnonate aldolase RhmA